MPSRKIEDCVQPLQEAWRIASSEYAKAYPSAPQVFLTCTYRSNLEQAELYAQGRTKAGARVTNIAKNGKHNSYPSKAFDIAFKKADGSLDWSATNFKNFAAIVKKTYPLIEWGGDWKSFKDLPHFQVA